MRSLKDRQAEIILDTNCAELSVPGRFSGSMKSAPWAAEGRLLEAADFTPGTNRSVIEPIARHVVKSEVAAVDRKSVVSGKSVSVRVDLGGRRIIKKKSKRKKNANT